MRMFLPEYHEFEYIAVAPWPVDLANPQIDWVTAIDTVEEWLRKYTGPQWQEWAFATQQDQEYWEACVAFRQAKYQTLFLLTWAR